MANLKFTFICLFLGVLAVQLVHACQGIDYSKPSQPTGWINNATVLDSMRVQTESGRVHLLDTSGLAPGSTWDFRVKNGNIAERKLVQPAECTTNESTESGSRGACL